MRAPRRTARAVLAVSAALCATLAGVSAASPGAPSYRTTTFKGGGGEPNVAVSPDGRTILLDGLGGSAGGGQPAALWRSTDSGKTYQRIRPDFPKSGGGDWDMRWLDNRTVIAVDLSLGEGIFVHRSTDRGSTWTTAQINMDVYDRPWVEHFGAREVYVVAKGFDAVPYAFFSHDGGATFDQTPTPLYGTGAVPTEAGGTQPTPVDALVTNQDAYVDHPVVDQRTGDFYVLYGIDTVRTYSPTKPLGEPDRLYVAHLDKQGLTPSFTSYPVYTGGAGDGFVSGFNWMTIDRAGTLYVLGNGKHAGHESMWLSYSKDHGQHWSSLVDVGKKGVVSVYGAIAGADPGVLSYVALRGTKETSGEAQSWYVETGRISKAASRKPTVTRTTPVKKPVHTKDICMDGILCGVPGFGDDRNLLDYIWTAVGPDGRAYSVITSDGPATGGSTDVILIQQRAGQRFGKGVAS